MNTHATSGRLPAPRITVLTLRAVLATGEGVAVQLPTGGVEAAPTGLTKAQANDADLVVVLTHDEAAAFTASTDGDHKAAAAAATAVLRMQHAAGYLDAAVEVEL